MQDTESRNVIAVAPSSALQIQMPAGIAARLAKDRERHEQQQFLATEDDSGPWLGFEVWDGCSPRGIKSWPSPPHCRKESIKCQRYVDIACVKLPLAMTTPKHEHD